MRQLVEPSHLDLCCLQEPIIIACGRERVNDINVFLQTIGFDISFNLSPQETICMKYQILFSVKIRNIF